MRDDKFVNRVIIGIIISLTTILGILLYFIYSDVINIESDNTKDTPIKTIKIWTIHGGIETILKDVAKEYESSHENIRIEISTFKNEVYQSTIQNAAITNELPDIYFFWGYEKLKQYVDLGLVWNISDAMQKYYEGESPVEEAMKGVTYNEDIYGMPIYGWNANLFCNRELFEKYGIEYPTTYSEFLKVIEKFKGYGITPIATGSKEMWLHSLYYMELVLSEGNLQGVYDAKLDHSVFRTPQFYNAAEKLEELIVMHPWGENYLESDAYDAAYLFSQGQAAMLLSGSWVAANIDDEGSKVMDKIDIIPFPGVPESVGVGGYVDALVVSSQSKITQDEELAKAYFYIAKEVSRKSVEEYGIGLPAYENYKIDKIKFPTLYKCEQETTNKETHPAYDQIFDEDFSTVYYDLLSLFMSQKITVDEFVDGLAK